MAKTPQYKIVENEIVYNFPSFHFFVAPQITQLTSV